MFSGSSDRCDQKLTAILFQSLTQVFALNQSQSCVSSELERGNGGDGFFLIERGYSDQYPPQREMVLVLDRVSFQTRGH